MAFLPSKLMTNLIFFLPVFKFGGAANSVVRLCKALSKKKYNIHIISIGTCDYKKNLINENLKFYELKKRKTLFLLIKLHNIVKKIISENKGKNIFVSGHHYANVASIIALRSIKNIKLFVVERTDIEELRIYYSFFKYLKNMIIYFLVVNLYKKADVIISNSAGAKKDLEKICKHKVVHIHPPSFQKYETVLKVKKNINKLKILMVGRLVKEKGIDTVLKALSLLGTINFTLDILGDGPEKQNLKNLKEKLSLKNVFFHGYKKNVKQFFLRSNLFINASHFEGFPNSLVEAINYGLPTICSDSKGGGSREILLNGKGGYLFPRYDYKALSKKIITFYKNPKILFKKTIESRKNIKNFSLKNNIKKYEALFDKV